MRKLSERGGFGLMSEQWDALVWDRPMWRAAGRLADFSSHDAMSGASAGKPVPSTIASDFPAVIPLHGLTPPTGFIIVGDAAADQAGSSVSSAGDVNNDGFDDVIVGAAGGDDGGSGAGEAYVIFGKQAGFGAIDLTGLAPADGFVIQGDATGNGAGFSVSGAADVNGDGFDDMFVGTGFSGRAYVIFGKAGGFGTIDLSNLAPADGFIIQGDAPRNRRVSAAGDVNGDGFGDLIVGVEYGDGGGVSAGEAYVIFGKQGGFGAIDLSNLAPADGFIIQGDAPDDRAGGSVSGAGDFNGDGFDDVIVGAPGGDNAGDSAGEAYVIFGRAGQVGTIDLTDLEPADGLTIQGDHSGDRAGFSVSGAGDVNGDGFDDLIVGAIFGDDGAPISGEAYVIFGRASGVATIDLTGLAPADGFVIRGGATFDLTGVSVSSAGDVNGDGFDDVIIGAPGVDDSGEAYVIFGKATGFGPIDLPSLTADDGFVIQGGEQDSLGNGDGAGRGVSSAGDMDADGFDDIIVGADLGDDGGSAAGEAYVIFGRAPATAVERIGAAADQTIRGGDFSDTLAGLGGADTLDGGEGDDSLLGGSDGDTLEGGLGNDALDGGDGDDSLAGGDGDDVFLMSGSGDAAETDIVDAGNGEDVLSFAGSSVAITLSTFGTASATQNLRTVVFDSNLDAAIGSGLDDSFTVFDSIDIDGGAGVDTLDESALTLSGETFLWDLDVGFFFGGIGGEFEFEIADIERFIAPGNSFDFVRGGAGDNFIDGGDLDDTLEGEQGDDTLLGGSGADTLVGGAGADALDGGDGVDWADYSSARKVIADLQVPASNNREALGDSYTSIENLRGGDLADQLRGDGNANRLEGGVRNDVIVGRAGNDTLVGGLGFDQLAGQQGVDAFLLESTDPVDYDRIVDLALNETILLDAAAFGLAPGALDPDAFVLGNGAQDAEDRLIYLESVGKLFFDPDGAGGEGRVLIAIIENRPTIDADNFIVI